MRFDIDLNLKAVTKMEEKYYIRSVKYSVQERETKNYGKVYDAVFRVITKDGVEKQKKLSGYKTKTALKEAHTKFINENCEYISVNQSVALKKQLKDAGKSIHTLEEMVSQYLKAISNQNKDSTIYEREKIYNSYILPKFKDTYMNELTVQVLYRWQDEWWQTKNSKTGEPYSYSYLSKVRTAFSALLTWCEGRYGYPNNFRSVKKPKKKGKYSSEMKYWTEEEFKQFIKVVDDPMYHCLFTVMFYTGRRFGEITALTPDDIRGDKIWFAKSVTRKTLDGKPFNITSTKSDKEDLIPVCKRVENELKSYGGEFPFLFGGDVPLHSGKVTRRFRTWCEEAGVPVIRLHDFRHSFVSMVLHIRPGDYATVAALISDTVEQVIKTYAHLYQADKMYVILKLGE